MQLNVIYELTNYMDAVSGSLSSTCVPPPSPPPHTLLVRVIRVAAASLVRCPAVALFGPQTAVLCSQKPTISKFLVCLQ